MQKVSRLFREGAEEEVDLLLILVIKLSNIIVQMIPSILNQLI